MDTTRRPASWSFLPITAAALVVAALCGCQDRAAADVSPGRDVSAVSMGPQAAPNRALLPARGAAAGRDIGHASLRPAPDLLAGLQERVGPQTAARLEGARDAGRAFAQRLRIEGQEAQSIADVFTQLALDIAEAERDTAAGSDERGAAVQRAAQNAIDGLRLLVPGSALPEAEREITRWTGDVPVKFSHPSPAEWERIQAQGLKTPQRAPLP